MSYISSAGSAALCREGTVQPIVLSGDEMGSARHADAAKSFSEALCSDMVSSQGSLRGTEARLLVRRSFLAAII